MTENTNDDLKILASVALDMAKSLSTVQQQMKTLQAQLQSYTVKLTAGLNRAASRARINSDIKSLKPSNIKVAGQLDTATTRKQVKEGLGRLKAQQVKIQGVLDRVATNKNLREQIQQLPKVEATANVKTEGAEQVENLRKQMDAASTSAVGMASKLYLARTALQLLRRTAKEAVETVKELDAAATNLAIITGGQSGETYMMLEEYNDLARELGATTIQISDAAASWLRQGKDAAETAELIEQSIMLSKVAMIDSETATKNLTSTMKGYKLAVEDAGSVVDKLAALDSKAAVTASDLAVAMSQTASSANIGGVSMDRLLGYLAAVQEVTQRGAETVGQSFKTIFARMGSIKLGVFFDDEGEDLSDVESSLKRYGIALRNAEGDFRDFGEVLDDVYAKWDKFRAVDQRAIAQAFAGTRQQENFLVLMENYGKALEYTGVAADSAGTALEKFEAYEDSIEAKSASFVAAMESLNMDTVDSDLVKDLIDGATAVVEFAEAAGLLRATLLSLGTGAALKGIQMIAAGFRNVSQHIINMGEAANILRRVDDVNALDNEQIKRLGTLTKGLSDSQLKLILSSQNLSTAQMQAILQASGLTSAEAAQKIQTLGLAAAQQTTTGATWSLTAALNGLKVAIMSNPIGALMTAIAAATVVFSLISNAIEDARQKEEEARQKMLEVADAAKAEADAVSDLYDVYAKASKAYQDGVGSKDDLTSATDSLLEKLGYEKSAISDLVEEYGTLEAAIDSVTKKSLEQKAASILEGYDAAKQAALNAAEDSMGWFSGSTITVKTNGDDKKFAELLQKAGYLTDADLPLMSTSLYTGINNYGDIDFLVEGYDKLLSIKELLESGIGSEYSAEELSGAGVYTDVVAKINAVSEEIEAYRNIIKAYNGAQAQIAYMGFVEANGVPETRDEYDDLKQSLLDTAEASGKYIGSQNDIEAAITNMLATRPALQEFFAASTEAAEGVSLYKDQLSELTDVLSALQSSHNALDAAQADMADGGGLTPETIEKLAKAEENYLDFLYTENGVVKLNTKAWMENAEAKARSKADTSKSELQTLRAKNAELRESLKYYEEQQNLGSDGGIWAKHIAETTAALQENEESIQSHENELSIWEAAIRGVANASDSLVSALSEISAVSGNIGKISNVLGTFSEEGFVDASSLSSLSDAFGNLDSFESFVNIMGNASASMEDAQNACNELASEYITFSGLLDNVNESTAQIIERELERIGVANAHELVQARLNAIELEGVLASKGLSDAEWELAEKTLASSGASETAIASLHRLRQEQYNASLAAADLATASAGTISSLLAQAKAAGVAADSIAGLSKAAALQKRFESGQATSYELNHYEELMAGYAAAAKADLSDLGSITLPQVEVALPQISSKGSSGGSGKKEVEEYTAAINEYREAEERLRKTQEDASNIKSSIDRADDIQDKINLENRLIAAYQQEQEALHNLNDLRRGTISAGVESLRELGFAVQYNANTNELWISNMERLNELTATSKGEYDTVQEATNALRKETEELIGTLEDLNEKNRDGSSTWSDLQDSIRDAKVDIVNDLKDIVDSAHDAVDEIQNVSDTLYGAADEFAENDGFLTIDAYQKLTKLGAQYMQMLKDENGVYQINEERVNAIIAAKTRQLAVENAMSYVERLRLAAQEGSIEDLNNLVFATTDASNATWGLVYAELELMRTMGELNESQYSAALHNVQVMQDLAENAVANIGKATGAVAKNLEEARKQLEETKDGLQDLLDELKDMEDGANDLVKYVMDMLKQRINDQIGLLEEMKKKYSEIIQLKKDSLDATKDEQDYQKTIAKKLKEMAKLQERVNALSMDDSRSAQAERAKLLEEMAELQEDLADTQAGKSIEAQKEALDKMEEDYHAEKDQEIKILEDSISSYQKLYDIAIAYIRDNWDTLYTELISWNTEYGSDLNSEVTAAWEAAQSAAQRYGDFVSAIMGGISSEIDGITRQIEDLDDQISNLSASASSSSSSVGTSGSGSGNDSKNTVVGNKSTQTSPTDEDMVRTIVGRMKEYSAAWSTNNNKAANNALHQKAADLARQLDQYGVHADFRNSDGTRWITQDRLNPDNVGKRLHSRYHTGGFVGDEPLKPNEQYIKAENGELVLTSDQQDRLAVQIDRIKALTEYFMKSPMLPPSFSMFDGLSQIERGTINNITNSSITKPVTINQGDVYIQGTVMGPKELAQNINKYIDVTERMINQYARLTGVKW